MGTQPAPATRARARRHAPVTRAADGHCRTSRQVSNSGVGEIIRYDSPLHSFRRTAVVDTELAGVRISASDKLGLCDTSANRDELVFPTSRVSNIRHRPNPHVSSGMGVHFCLGAHIVRSNLNNSYKRLPIHLAA